MPIESLEGKNPIEMFKDKREQKIIESHNKWLEEFIDKMVELDSRPDYTEESFDIGVDAKNLQATLALTRLRATLGVKMTGEAQVDRSFYTKSSTFTEVEVFFENSNLEELGFKYSEKWSLDSGFLANLGERTGIDFAKDKVKTSQLTGGVRGMTGITARKTEGYI